jgi:hypothetical protein
MTKSKLNQDDDLIVIPSNNIVKPNELFRGLSYGDFVVNWTNWLMGDRPDYYDGGDILFLRGNVGYYNEQNTFYDRGDIKLFRNEGVDSIIGNGLMIRDDTAVLIPVITSQFDIGDHYGGAKIDDEVSLRRAVHDDLNSGGEMWATICEIKEGESAHQASKLVNENLEDYRVETPRFKMIVSEQNPFREKMEVPKEPGTYDAVTGGYFILIKKLPAGKRFVIRFGAKGRGNYYTDAVYDIKVEGRRLKSVQDISGPTRYPVEVYKEMSLEPMSKNTSVFQKFPRH